MKVQWVSDGYCGGERPRSFEFDDSEIQLCGSVEEAIKQIEESIQNDFLDKVSPSYDLNEIRDEVARIWKLANK